jgi:dihydroorotase
MGYDLLIRGGQVVDPANGRQGLLDVAVAQGVIAAVGPALRPEAAGEIVDAQGQIVTPGLVDLHTHCYWGATYWGIEADPVAARTGVTTWLDAGSAGAYTFPSFRRYVVDANRARVLALLNLAAIGLVGRTYELSNLEHCDVGLAAATVEAHRDIIVGIKARIDRETVQGAGLEPLRRARQLADRVALPLMVHIGTAPPVLAEIATLLRAGDILTHCCTGQANSLVGGDGAIHPVARQLREAGVILDVGHGGGSFSFAVAAAMLEAGMLPDVISSDIHQFSVLGPLYDLPTTLAKFLALGMTLPEVIARATVRPAAAMRRPDLGHLSVGAAADIAVFRVEERNDTLYDTALQLRPGRVRLVNTATYIGGRRLPRLPERDPALWVPAPSRLQQETQVHAG